MRRTLRWSWAWLILLGCAAEPDRPATHTVTDSAGIAIVHSFAPGWEDAERWTIAAEPYLEIGAVEGEEPYLLDRVVGVARLEDGRAAVAMAGDNTIRFYDSEGEYLSRVGGSGDGPGEFSRLRSLLRTPGRLYGRQLPSRPINVYDEATGTFLEAISPPEMPGPGASFQGVFDDGSLMFRAGSEGTPPASGAYAWSAAVVRVTTEGLVDTLGVFPAQTFVRTSDRGSTAQQFGPNLRLAVAGDRFYRGHSSSYEIAEHSLDGAVQRVIRRAWEPLPVTDEDVSRRKEESRSRGTEDEFVDAMIYPDHHPAFATLRVDRAGNLWAQRPDPERTRLDEVMGAPDDTPAPWDVFSGEGVWLGTVEQPARFRIMEIGDDYMAGVWVDELGVEFVRFYEIVKPVGQVG